MKLVISYNFEKSCFESFKKVLQIFCKSKFEDVEVERYPDILVKNPITGIENRDRVEKVSWDGFFDNTEKYEYCHSIKFNFKDSEDIVEVFDNTHLSLFTNHSIDDVLAKLKPVLSNEFINGVSYFNTKDKLCKVLGLGFGFRPLQTCRMTYFPGNLLVLNEKISQTIGISFLESIGSIKQGDFYVLKLSDSFDDFSTENTNKGLISFFNRKYNYSSHFEKQKKIVNRLLECDILNFDNKFEIEQGFKSYGNKILGNDELFSFYWLNDGGEIVHQYRSSHLYYIKSKGSETIEEKVVKVNEIPSTILSLLQKELK